MRRTNRVRLGQSGESGLGAAAALLGIISALLTILVTLVQLGVLGSFRVPGLPGAPAATTQPGSPAATNPPIFAQATLSVSRGSGPSGTQITLSGTGFSAGETVEIRFHTELIATARAGGDGSFSGVPARIPGSFDAFAPQQFEISASGNSSARSARVPFQLTR